MLTGKQKLILSELRHNSRQPISKIAKKLNLPLSTCHDHYKGLKQYISHNTTLIDFAKTGYSLRINFIFKANDDIIDLLIESRHINTIQRINNNALLIDCLFKNMCQAYEFKESLNDLGINNVEMRYIIEEIKKESFLK